MKEQLLIKVLEKLLESSDEPPTNPQQPTNKGWNIVVLDRGWVCVGMVSSAANKVMIKDAHHIRRWGTSKGLGELIDGPTEETILDYCGYVETHELSVNHMIKVKDSKWDELKRT